MIVIDKVTTVTNVFVSVILNFNCPVAKEIAKSSDQVKLRLISQLINGLSRVFPRLLKKCNDTTNFSFFHFLALIFFFPLILDHQ